MEVGDYITTAIAVGALAITWWQARTAQRATDAQLRAQREQRDQEKADRDRTDCPQFIVQETDVRGGEGDVLEVIAVIKQTAGSDLDEARVTVHLNEKPAHVIGGADDGTLLWLHTGTNALRHLKLFAPDGPGRHLEIRVDLVCRERGGGRSWTCRVFGYPQAEWERILGSVAAPEAPPAPPSSPAAGGAGGVGRAGGVGSTDGAGGVGDAGGAGDSGDRGGYAGVLEGPGDVRALTDDGDDADGLNGAGDADGLNGAGGADLPGPPDAAHTAIPTHTPRTSTTSDTNRLPGPTRRPESLSMAHWQPPPPHSSAVPRSPAVAHWPPYPETVYPTLVHPEDVGLLAVTPVAVPSYEDYEVDTGGADDADGGDVIW
ncbi:hypothetical protein [Streptomyces sp. NPDC087300]|uniref:hypothetical protein n=1 Tax=Streptomyces sp. NPDC087300 TaxID=3365780 RepID=UPI0037F79210